MTNNPVGSILSAFCCCCPTTRYSGNTTKKYSYFNNNNNNITLLLLLLLLTFIVVGWGAAVIHHVQLQWTPDEVVMGQHNIFSGAVIFTIGDIGAQWLTMFARRPSFSPSSSQPLRTKPKHMGNTSRSSGTSLWVRPYVLIMLLRDANFCLDRQRLAISTTLGALWLGIANPAVYMAVERAFPGSDSW
eukprot:scaffold1725_cov98-Amphora_coffeaeformis.AAC.1